MLRQTDDESELVHWLHEAADSGAPVILNAGAWTHYSYAIRDALDGADVARAPLWPGHPPLVGGDGDALFVRADVSHGLALIERGAVLFGQ